MNIKVSKIAEGIKEYLLMIVGMSMYAFGWVECVIPAGGMGGGATGLSMIFNHFFPMITIGQFVFILNAILLLIAGFIVGWNFGIKTIFCIIVLSIAMDSWEVILSPDVLISYVQTIDSHNILMVILGAVIAGAGVAICFAQGGSTGGTDIVASSLFIANDIAMGVATMIYGYIMVAVFGYTVDLIQSGNQQSSQIFIISPEFEAIADAINHEARRGATVIDGKGWYTKNDCKIVMVVCRKRDASMILKIAHRIDGNAFITMGSVMGVYGQGFEALSKI